MKSPERGYRSRPWYSGYTCGVDGYGGRAHRAALYNRDFVYGILAVRGRFEHLYRSSNGSGDFGLGLSICKDLLERIGGEISIPSEGGSGTLVEITPPQDGTPRKGGK